MKKGAKMTSAVGKFKNKVGAWADRVRVNPSQVRLQNMTRKWASCSMTGRVTFSLALLKMPVAFQDYVIVHELVHLKVPNHSKLFKSYLAAYLPNWKKYAALARRD